MQESEEDPIAFAAFAEVETTGTFEVRRALGAILRPSAGVNGLRTSMVGSRVKTWLRSRGPVPTTTIYNRRVQKDAFQRWKDPALV